MTFAGNALRLVCDTAAVLKIESGHFSGAVGVYYLFPINEKRRGVS